MAMEITQTVDVDRAVVHPDDMQQVGGSGRSLAEKCGLVDQVEYVAHLSKPCRLPTLSAVRANPLGPQSLPPSWGVPSPWWRSTSIHSGRPKGPVAGPHSSWACPADTQGPKRRPVPASFPPAPPAIRPAGAWSPWSHLGRESS